MQKNDLAGVPQLHRQNAPLVKGSTIFRTRKLKASTDKIIVVPTLPSLMLAVLILIAPSMLVIGGFKSLDQEPLPATITLILGALGTVITFVLLLKVWSARISFDKQSGNMVKSGLFLDFGPDLSRWFSLAPPNELKKVIPLSELAELQVLEELSEVGVERPRRFMGYELILVAKDKSRHLIMDHGNREKLEEDAEILSEFLGVPITRHSDQPPNPFDALSF